MIIRQLGAFNARPSRMMALASKSSLACGAVAAERQTRR